MLLGAGNTSAGKLVIGGIELDDKMCIRDSANAEVAGNGVRLRNNPNTNSKILELMYSGEFVWIDWSKYGKGGLEWFYVQRLKTGTYCWVSKEYIAQWD